MVLPRPVSRFACSPWHWLALDDAGTLWTSPAEADSRPYVIATAISGVVQLVAGSGFSMAVLDDGSVWMWGDTAMWGLPLPPDGEAIRVVALEGSRRIVARQTAFSNEQLLVAIGLDGSLRQWDVGDAYRGQPPLELPLPRPVVDAAVSYVHALALTDDGHVWSWGRANTDGQLGLGDLIVRDVPTEIPGFSGMQAVAVSDSSSYALDGDGNLWRWGFIPTVARDDGVWDGVKQGTPVQFEGLTGVVAINASRGRVFAVTADGALWAWGRNDYGWLGDGTRESSVDPVRVIGFGEDAPASPLPPAPMLAVNTEPGAVTVTVEADDLRNGLLLFYAPYPDAGFVDRISVDERVSRFELPSGSAYYVGAAIDDSRAGIGISALSNVEHFVVP
ncbi:RCC1 domain-containing protein [Endothiovibrio diazotrophicus]